MSRLGHLGASTSWSLRLVLDWVQQAELEAQAQRAVQGSLDVAVVAQALGHSLRQGVVVHRPRVDVAATLSQRGASSLLCCRHVSEEHTS